MRTATSWDVMRWMLLSTVTLPTSGCLLAKEIVPADAEIRPLRPTAIIQDPNKTDPLPGELIILPPSSAPQQQLEFKVTVAREDDEPLQARFFRNRARPCQSNLGGNNCGLSQRVAVDPPDEGEERTFQQTIVFTTFGSCDRVDLYVSPAFQTGDPSIEHEPERAGDVVHARWFVVRRQENGDLPSLGSCVEP